MAIPTTRCEECECIISTESACECYQCHRVLCAEHCDPTSDSNDARCITCASAEAEEGAEGWIGN